MNRESQKKISIVGYAEDEICAHCGRYLKHGIKISDGRIVGADCFDKQITKQSINGKKEISLWCKAHHTYRPSGTV